MKYRVAGDGWEREFEVRRDPLGREWNLVDAEGERHEFELETIEGPEMVRLFHDGVAHTVTLLPGNRPGQPLRFLLDDEFIELGVEDPIDLLTGILADSGGGAGREEMRSVMPGIIRKVLVEEGGSVEAGTPIFILEAMKMENEVTAPIAGTSRADRGQRGGHGRNRRPPRGGWPGRVESVASKTARVRGLTAVDPRCLLPPLGGAPSDPQRHLRPRALPRNLTDDGLVSAAPTFSPSPTPRRTTTRSLSHLAGRIRPAIRVGSSLSLYRFALPRDPTCELALPPLHSAGPELPMTPRSDKGKQGEP